MSYRNVWPAQINIYLDIEIEEITDIRERRIGTVIGSCLLMVESQVSSYEAILKRRENLDEQEDILRSSVLTA